MKTVKVINKGKKIRNRLDHSFPPNEVVELSVSSRQFITLNAVKDFSVEIIGEGEDDKEDQGEFKKDQGSSDPKISDEEIAELSGMTIEKFLEEVIRLEMEPEKAIEIEKAGKDRSTLIEQLMDLQVQDGE